MTHETDGMEMEMKEGAIMAMEALKQAHLRAAQWKRGKKHPGQKDEVGKSRRARRRHENRQSKQHKHGMGTQKCKKDIHPTVQHKKKKRNKKKNGNT